MPTQLPALPDPTDLDAAADPAHYVIASCERAKAWLAQCLAGDHIEAIVETKAQAEAIRVYTMQKQLGKDAELSAQEIVRRAERCIGLAIRKGQAEGRITPKNHGIGPQRDYYRGEKLVHVERGRDKTSVSPAQYFDHATERVETYAMSDVPDECFEAALAEAKAEHNLSRANVVRKVKGENGKGDRWKPLAKLAAAGHTSDQIAAKLGFHRSTVVEKAKALGIEITADKVVGKRRATNHDRVLSEFVNTMESLVPSVDLIDLGRVSRDVLAESLEVMDEAMRALSKFRRRLRGAADGS